MNQHSSKKSKHYSPLIGAALATVSLFHFSLPAFAAGTEAGLELKNRATATYEDQNNEPYDVISNEVTVTVGKIAGITNVPRGIDTPDAIQAGDTVGFLFDVTNTGNDVSDIYIPDTAAIGGYANTTNNLTINSVEYSTDGGTTFVNRSTLTNGIIPNVLDNQTIIVRVNVTVDSGASETDPIAVQLGNTDNNNNQANTQNQPDLPAAGDIDTEDVRTETATYTDGSAGTPKVDSEPINGQREASAVNSTTVGANPLALPRILKDDVDVDNNGSEQDLTDDIITYNLQLDVLSQAQLPSYTNFNFTPEALEGRDYSAGNPNTGEVRPAGGATSANIPDVTNLILISDAVPQNTELSEPVTKPAGSLWTPVYTDSPLTTSAEEATWSENLGALNGNTGTPSDVTRVGWVYDARTAGGNGPIAAGASITSAAGFSFKVVTSGFTTGNTASVYNMAQVFGSTDDKVDVVPAGQPNAGASSTGGQITFDESGDQNPNNLTDGTGTPGPDETVTFDVDLGDGNGTVATYGFADPDPANEDPGNNTGTGDGGEANKVDLTVIGQVTSAILNGPGAIADPNGGTIPAQPDAVGNLFIAPATADDNHDFQNQSTPTTDVTQQTDATTGQVTSVIQNVDGVSTTFNNTVQNPGSARINGVILQPVSPEALGLSGTAAELQNGTTVTITYVDGTVTRTATYTYDSSNTGSFSLTGSTTDGAADGTATQITIDFINGGDSVDYTAEVTLPDQTPLSTNYVGGDPNNANVGGYPVPIVAYVDDDNTPAAGSGVDGTNLTTADTYNVTINQAYTGFLKLVKRARVFRRVDPLDPNSAYSTSPVPGMDFAAPDADKNPAPGDRVEYEITFENIAESANAGGGSGNYTLIADDIRVTEDGTAAPNNWGVDATGAGTDGNPTGDGVIDTLHVRDTAAIDINTSVTTTITRKLAAADAGSVADTEEEITFYEAYIQQIEPEDEGTFTFQRKVSEPSDAPTTP